MAGMPLRRLFSSLPSVSQLPPIIPSQSFHRLFNPRLLGGAFTATNTSGGIRCYHKLKVAGLSNQTTDESIVNYFSKFGEVISTRVKRDRLTKESRGFGYVVFAGKDEFDKAMSVTNHVVDERQIKVTPVPEQFVLVIRGVPKGYQSQKAVEAYFSMYTSYDGCYMIPTRHTVYQSAVVYFTSQKEVEEVLAAGPHAIAGQAVQVIQVFPQELSIVAVDLPEATTSDGLHKYFSAFGTLQKAEVIYDQKTNKSRRYGFVEYATRQGVNNAIACTQHTIDGQEVMIYRRKANSTLFVAGFPPATITAEQLSEHFEQFGQVHSCNIGRDQETNQLLGFGFVYFSTQQGLDNAINASPHIVYGQKVNVTRNDFARKRELSVTVKHLPPDATEDMLFHTFSKLGKVTGYNIVQDLKTGTKKNWGIVFFSSADMVQKALASGPHFINGKQVEVCAYDYEVDLSGGERYTCEK